MIDNLAHAVSRFFKVMISTQPYLNLLYLLAAFPLGVLYFCLLVSGLSLGISLLIVWIGVPILLLFGVGWWQMARFERSMVVHVLKDDLPAMSLQDPGSGDMWSRFKLYLRNPVTWKSPLYLLLKLPLGLGTFVILSILVPLTLSLLSMPFIYRFVPGLQVGAFLEPGLPTWSVNSTGDSIACALVGLALWPVTLHVANGLAWVHAKFARVMLSVYPWGGHAALAEA